MSRSGEKLSQQSAWAAPSPPSDADRITAEGITEGIVEATDAMNRAHACGLFMYVLTGWMSVLGIVPWSSRRRLLHFHIGKESQRHKSARALGGGPLQLLAGDEQVGADVVGETGEDGAVGLTGGDSRFLLHRTEGGKGSRTVAAQDCDRYGGG